MAPSSRPNNPPRGGLVLFTPDKSSIVIVKGAGSNGKWSFPKGKVEAGETRVQAAVRECLEESGIAPSEYVLLGQLFSFYDATMFMARMHKADTEVRVPPRPHEIEEVRWVPLNMLHTYADTANKSLRYFISHFAPPKPENGVVYWSADIED